MIASLFLAQPVLGQGTSNKVTSSDAESDLRICSFHNAGYAAWGPAFGGLGPPWPAKSPVGKAAYLDIKEASIEKQGDTFVLMMTMWCNDLMAQVDLPLRERGGLAIWEFSLINVDPFYHWELGLCWDGSNMLPFGFPTDFTWSITVATITISFDEDQMGDPSSLEWGYCTILCLSPPQKPITGGFWWVDLPDCIAAGGSPWLSWPA